MPHSTSTLVSMKYDLPVRKFCDERAGACRKTPGGATSVRALDDSCHGRVQSLAFMVHFSLTQPSSSSMLSASHLADGTARTWRSGRWAVGGGGGGGWGGCGWVLDVDRGACGGRGRKGRQGRAARRTERAEPCVRWQNLMKIGQVVTSRTAAPDRMSAVKLRWSVQLRRMVTIGSWLRSKKELITHLGRGVGAGGLALGGGRAGQVTPAAAAAATAQAQQPRQPWQPWQVRQERRPRLRPEAPAESSAARGGRPEVTAERGRPCCDCGRRACSSRSRSRRGRWL